jgi:hypothetical protein
MGCHSEIAPIVPSIDLSRVRLINSWVRGGLTLKSVTIFLARSDLGEEWERETFDYLETLA